ncbi:MAG: LysR family transcriptional regulator [Gammaproteobacteria bacterium]|nr:MAG: LysR family transcriptional regulator [Gammaproteobacteria bacterium]
MTEKQTTLYAALVLRLGLGTVFIAHALLKIIVFTPAGTVGFFASLGVPGGLAYLVMIAELVGGTMLLLGAKVRLVSLALIPILIGAIVLVHGHYGWLASNEGGGWEYSAFLIVAAVVQSLLGNGAFSVNSLSNKVN